MIVPLYLATALLVLLPALHGQANPEFEQAFAWYTARHSVDLGSAPFVRLATGQSVQRGTRERTNTYKPAFLIEDKGQTFTVWTFAQKRETFTRSTRGTAEDRRIGYKPASWSDHLRALRKAIENTASGNPSYGRGIAGYRTSAATELFLHAWICQLREEHQNACIFGEAAIELAKHENEASRDLQRHLENELSKLALWETIEAFADPTETWRQLRTRCDTLLARYPNSRSVARCQALRNELIRVIAATPPTSDDGIDRWIYELRQQNGPQIMQPGSVLIFMDPRGSESAAAKLEAIGLPAIPALLKVLEDKTLTRSVGFHRSFYFSHKIYRVGDCARDIINKIAGRSFPHKTRAEFHQCARQWWKQIQTRGERSVLAEAVIAADKNSPRQAVQLLKRYPEHALPAIRTAIENASSAFLRCRLIAVAGWCGKDAAPLLRHIQATANDLRVRCAAAGSLHAIDPESSILAMLTLWRDLGTGNSELGNSELGNSELSNSDASSEIGEFLAVCGSSAAILAIAERPELIDDDVVRALQHGTTSLSHTAISNAPRSARTAINLAATDATQKAREQCLKLLLTATKELPGNYGGTNDPSVADFAAKALAELWPSRYSFDFGAVRMMRQRQVRELLNAERKRKGLPALDPVCTRRALPGIDTSDFARRLSRLTRASTELDRSHAADRIHNLGIGALPLIRAELEARKGPAEDTVRSALKHVAANLCADVSEYRQDPTEQEAPRWSTGKLDAKAITTWIRAFVTNPPAGFNGLELRADRGSGTDAALKLHLEFLQGDAREAQRARTNIYVRIGRNALLGSHGAGKRSVSEGPNSFASFQRALNRALHVPFESLEVSFRIELY